MEPRDFKPPPVLTIEQRRKLGPITRAMNDPDQWALSMKYTDKAGQKTERTVSPIRLEGGGIAVLAMCLCREEPRRFELDRMEELALVPAHEILAPVPIAQIS